MSYRMCGICNNVVDNTCYKRNKCPDCGENKWADPNGFNNEWGIIYQQQIKILILEGELKELKNEKK